MATLADLNKTLQDQNNLVSLVERNTDKTQKYLDNLLQSFTGLSSKERDYEKAKNVPRIQMGGAGGAAAAQAGMGFGLGAMAAGMGKGLGAAGAGLGAFFLGLAGAEAIMQSFGNGGQIKNLLTNLAEGLAAFETRDLAALGAVLGFGAVAGAVPGLSGTAAGMGMGAVGAGLGAFFAGLAAGDKAMSWIDTDFTALKRATKGLSDALAELSPEALKSVGALLLGGGVAGALFGPSKVGKAAIGMGAIGLGIGAFFAGLSAGDAAASWMNTDGEALKNMMINVGEGLSGLVAKPEALAAVAGLLAAGSLFGPSRVAKAGVGMGAIGLGIGAFFAGLSVADLVGVDGTNIKNIMINLAEGLSAFSSEQLAGLSALLVTGGLFGPGAGGAAAGMGLIGAGLGAFFTGFAAVGKLGDLVGVDGSSIKNIMTNTAEGLKAFNDLDGKNLLNAAGGILAIGPAIAAYMGMEGLGKIVSGITDTVKGAWNWMFGADESGTPDPKKNKLAGIVESLKPFNELDASKLSGFNQLTNDLDKFAESLNKIINTDTERLKRAFSEIATVLGSGMSLNASLTTNERQGSVAGVASETSSYINQYSTFYGPSGASVPAGTGTVLAPVDNSSTSIDQSQSAMIAMNQHLGAADPHPYGY